MIDTVKNMPDVKIKLVNKGNIEETTSRTISNGKKIILFGVPGAFTSTCSNKHLPSYISLADNIKKKGIDEIYSMSVNDPNVMKAWQSYQKNGNKIIMENRIKTNLMNVGILIIKLSATLLLISLIILLLGASPIEVMESIIYGSFGKPQKII